MAFVKWSPDVLARVRALHAAGLLDRDIAARMPDVFRPGPAGRMQVKGVRERLGLRSHRDMDSAARHTARLGESGAGSRAGAHRRFAERCGWPADLPPRAVQILNELADRGPMTADQLAAALGMRTERATGPGKRWKGVLTCSFDTHGYGTYTALLKARGLIAGVARARAGGGNRPSVYTLTLAAAAARKEALDERHRRDEAVQSGRGAGPHARPRKRR